MTRRVLLSPRPTLVIDTNILLLLIGYACSRLDKQSALERSRILNDIRGRDRVSPDGFDNLWRVFETAATRIVTQHVIAEAYGLRKRLGSGYRKDLVWQGTDYPPASGNRGGIVSGRESGCGTEIPSGLDSFGSRRRGSSVHCRTAQGNRPDR